MSFHLSDGKNWKQRLQNYLNSVDGDVKPQFKQTKVHRDLALVSYLKTSPHVSSCGLRLR